MSRGEDFQRDQLQEDAKRLVFDVFISYQVNDTDRGRAERLADCLEMRGLRVYMCEKVAEQFGGTFWRDRNVLALEQSTVAVFVYTEQFAKSGECAHELRIALNANAAPLSTYVLMYDERDPSAEPGWTTVGLTQMVSWRRDPSPEQLTVTADRIAELARNGRPHRDAVLQKRESGLTRAVDPQKQPNPVNPALLISIDGVLGQVKHAVAKGLFVPVLGPGVSASLHYANPPRDEFRWSFPSGAVGINGSQQARARAEYANRIHASQLRLKSAGMFERALGLHCYVNGLGGQPCPGDALPRAMEELIDAATVLACTFTVAWAASLAKKPSPLKGEGEYVDNPVDPPEDELRALMYEMLRKGIRACISLRRQRNEPEDLHVEWIQKKLMMLAAQLAESPGTSFWSSDHDPYLQTDCQDLITEDDGVGMTGWTWETGQSIRRARSAGDVGIRLAHVLWLEGLLRHCLQSGTSAYRRPDDLAFLLSLDERVIGLPGGVAEPFAIGLVHTARTGGGLSEKDMDDLVALLRHCSTSDNGGGARVPGAFHGAIARLVRRSQEHQKPFTERSRQTILSMSLDMEMERALEEVFDAYRVLIPVTVPLRGKESTAEHTWAMGHRRKVEESYVTEKWTLVGQLSKSGSAPTEEFEGEGPLLIKLFGSPLQDDLWPIERFSNYGPVDASGHRQIRHRVAVDEADLLYLLLDALPDEVTGLTDRLRRASLFFFGQDAVTWGGRMPFFVIDAVGDHQPDLERKDGRTRAVAVGRAGLVGGSALERLRVTRAESAEEIKEIAHGLIELVETYRPCVKKPTRRTPEARPSHERRPGL
jgi:hypothetical protein